MEMNYGIENEHPLHDNIFYDGWANAKAWAVTVGAGWGLKKLGSKEVFDDFITRAERAKFIGPSLQRYGPMPPGKTYKAGKSFSRLGRILGWTGIAQIGYAIGKSAVTAFTDNERSERDRYREQYDQDTYYDTRAAYTQRQRALQVIHNSRLSLRPVLGNESSYLHY
jgi:hypothetical protein